MDIKINLKPKMKRRRSIEMDLLRDGEIRMKKSMMEGSSE